jgi:preprotein translocase subunit YajC
MPDPVSQPTALGSFLQFVPIIVIFFVIFWMSSSSQRKEKKRKEQLLATLSKGQKVQSIGGIVGTIEEVKDDLVVILVDERNKSTLTFSKSSINNVVE